MTPNVFFKATKRRPSGGGGQVERRLSVIIVAHNGNNETWILTTMMLDCRRCIGDEFSIYLILAKLLSTFSDKIAVYFVKILHCTTSTSPVPIVLETIHRIQKSLGALSDQLLIQLGRGILHHRARTPHLCRTSVSGRGTISGCMFHHGGSDDLFASGDGQPDVIVSDA
jgi:hypothetical protein